MARTLAITGDPTLGDRLEKVAFNALPGTFTDDMWAHQYNQQPNQVEVGLLTKPWTTDGPESNLYGLEPNFGCCTANFHQGWPKLAASLWMASADGGLVAAVYAPCEVRTKVRGTDVRVVVETEYPFRDTVRMTVSPGAPVSFPLRLRIPAWAEGEPRVQRIGGSGARAAGVLVCHRPGLGEAAGSWDDGGLAGVSDDALALSDRAIEVEESAVGVAPFSLKGASVKLKVEARSLMPWQAVDGVADAVPVSPVVSAEAVERVTLVPYGAAKLRVTAFPQLKDV